MLQKYVFFLKVQHHGEIFFDFYQVNKWSSAAKIILLSFLSILGASDFFAERVFLSMKDAFRLFSFGFLCRLEVKDIIHNSRCNII